MTWNLDPVMLRGSAPMTYYGLIFALTVVGGFFIWRWQMRRGGHSDEVSAVFMAYGLAGVVLGARLGHCLFYDLQRCLASPLTVLKVWEGGLSSHGATVGLAATLLLFARHNRIPLAEVTDRFSLAAALGACTIRIANFVNSEIVGRVTDVSWGVRFPRFDRALPLDQVPPRHPSQLYEAALGLAVLAVLLVVDRRYKERRPRGLLSALFLTLYFGGRIAVELFKERQALPHFPLSMGQLLSLPPLAVGLWWLLRLRLQRIR